MSRSESTPEVETKLAAAYARHDDLLRSLLAMNGGDPDLYAGMGRNEGYDSLLCALRSELGVIEELKREKDEEPGTDR